MSKYTELRDVLVACLDKIETPSWWEKLMLPLAAAEAYGRAEQTRPFRNDIARLDKVAKTDETAAIKGLISLNRAIVDTFGACEGFSYVEDFSKEFQEKAKHLLETGQDIAIAILAGAAIIGTVLVLK